MQTDYDLFCAEFKQKYNVDIHPQDDIFPIIYELLMANQKNTLIIDNLNLNMGQGLDNLNDGLNKLQNSNQSLYENQAVLVEKNKELLRKVPKNHILLDSPQTAKEYWFQKSFHVLRIALAAAIIIMAITLGIFFSIEWKGVYQWMAKQDIETVEGQKYLILYKTDDFNKMTQQNCIEFTDGKFLVPLYNKQP